MSESEGRYQRWGSGGLIGYRAWPPPSATQHHSDGETTPHPTETGGWSWSSMTQRRTSCGATRPVQAQLGVQPLFME